MSMCVANSYSINKNKMAALNSPKHTPPANLLKTDDVNTHAHTHAGECIHSEKSGGYIEIESLAIYCLLYVLKISSSKK